MDDKQFMQIALSEAEIALSNGKLPVGAIAVLDDQVIARGNKTNGRLGHAEMIVLNVTTDGRTAEECQRITIYTTLEPCVMCFGAMLNCGIGSIVYAMEDPYGGALEVPKEYLPPRHHNNFPSIIDGILRDEAKELLEKFFLATNDPFWSQQQKNPLVLACLDKLS